jgi:hypothetical protein
MSIYVGHKAFAGPFDTVEQVQDRAGLYAVLRKDGRGHRVEALDQSANLRHAVEQYMGTSTIGREKMEIAVLYTPGIQKTGRLRMLEEIKINLD